MGEFPNPYAEPADGESPGELAQRWGKNCMHICRYVGMNVTPKRQEALSILMQMLIDWGRKFGRRKR